MSKTLALAQLPRTILHTAETNLDDMNPELAPSLIAKLFDVGARDAWLSPIIMKQGRPGFCLHVLFEPELENAVLALLFSETSTLGVRISRVERVELHRHQFRKQTEFGEVMIKVGTDTEGVVVNVAPEYGDCLRLAEASGVPLKQVYQAAIAAVGSWSTLKKATENL